MNEVFNPELLPLAVILTCNKECTRKDDSGCFERCAKREMGWN